MKRKRNRIVSDWKIQGNLCIRVAVYLVISQALMIVTMYAFANLESNSAASETSSNMQSVTTFLIPGLCAAVFILPIMLLDLIAFSNRFAGPLFNFRRKFAKLAETGESEEIFFRKGDYFDDLAEGFNQLRLRLDEDADDYYIQAKKRENAALDSGAASY